MLRNINCSEFLWIQTTIYYRSVNSLCSIRVIKSVYLFNINAKMAAFEESIKIKGWRDNFSGDEIELLV